ncbi:MAG: hypothetical protein ACUVTL_09500 [Thermoproteota archaeon]
MLIAQTVFWASSSINPTSIPMERRVKTFERYLSAPLSLTFVLFGKTLAGMIYGVAISTLSILLGIFVFGSSITKASALIIGVGSFFCIFSDGHNVRFDPGREPW